MDNASLAARAVANSPGVGAPASFNGVEWLVALNLWALTAAFGIGAMVLVTLLADWRRYRALDVAGVTPARTYRWSGLLMTLGLTMRTGAGALVLWGWDTADPNRTGALLFIQRIVDPIALAFGISGLMLFVLSLPGVFRQLRREPVPLDIWQAWPVVRRMIAVGVLWGIAAVGVVVTR